MPLTITSIVRIVDVIEKEVEKPPVEFITSASMPRTLGDVVATENHYVNKTFRNVRDMESLKRLIKSALNVHKLMSLALRSQNDHVLITTPIVNYDGVESNLVKRLDGNIIALGNKEPDDVISKLDSIFDVHDVSEKAKNIAPLIVNDLAKLFNNNQFNDQFFDPIKDWTLTVMNLDGQYVYVEKHKPAQHPLLDLKENTKTMYRIKCKFFKGTRFLQITNISLSNEPYCADEMITVLGV